MSAQRIGLAGRVMIAQLIVIAVGAVTLLIAALLVAPPLFSGHLAESGVTDPDSVDHAEQAFASAYLVSLAVGSAAAILAASIIAWLLVTRVAPPLRRLSDATRQVAAGNFDTPIPEQGFGAELDTLTHSLRQMAGQLQHVEQSRTQMLNDLAHEVGTPLATLQAFVDGLEDGVVEPVPETYEVLRNQISRLRRLTDDIRQAATSQDPALGLDLRPLSVRDQVQLAVDLASPQFQAAGVTLDAAVQPPTSSILGDEERLQQVFTNVLANALRHTPAGGRVHIDARNRDRDVVISISDTGEGIAADQLESIFDRFHRGDPARTIADSPTGAGLGLTIARTIINDHDGSITAASPGPGRGSTITITLPAQERPRDDGRQSS